MKRRGSKQPDPVRDALKDARSAFYRATREIDGAIRADAPAPADPTRIAALLAAAARLASRP